MSQNAELLEEARAVRVYKDELDIFREQVRHFVCVLFVCVVLSCVCQVWST